MHVIVPVKAFTRAKSRLASVLDVEQRVALAYALVRDVLAELTQVSGLERVVVASSEPLLRDLVDAHGYEFLLDAPDAGLNEALTRAMASLFKPGDGMVAVVCADLPLFSAAEFERMAKLHASALRPSLTVAPDYLGQGTNVRINSADVFVPCLYGPGSAAAHMWAATAQGLAVQVFDSPALSLDVDRPENLSAIARAAPASIRPDSSAALVTGWARVLDARGAYV